MVLRAPGDLVLDEVVRPRQDASQVQVRVTHSGILRYHFKIYSGAIPVSYPRIMGHEMFGEVVETGAPMRCGVATASSSIPSCTAANASIAGSADAPVPEWSAGRPRHRRRFCRLSQCSSEPRLPCPRIDR